MSARRRACFERRHERWHSRGVGGVSYCLLPERGGVGEATLRLPSDIGIWAEAQGGIGSIDVRGLRRNGDHWESESFPRSKVKIKVDVHGGIGAVHLIAD